jgi:prepilin-type N-terminal cleavage/methylation domain-containing protein
MMTKIQQKILLDQRGLTLAEIIAVLVIIGVLSGLVVPQFIDLESGAKQKAIDSAIGELNGREQVTWADQKISASGYDASGCPGACAGDDDVWGRLAPLNLGDDYIWNAGPLQASGGTIDFKGTAVVLARTPSDISTPGTWKR